MNRAGRTDAERAYINIIPAVRVTLFTTDRGGPLTPSFHPTLSPLATSRRFASVRDRFQRSRTIAIWRGCSSIRRESVVQPY